ncbi:C69 family dipeptidase [Enterococcus innesii]|uniref:C69 family dipeptidase n=1 Tax=Enterococcus innesii TaxID=2839759 RepID=UPI0022B974D6|nr:C69 family dipeptidase [Enterococcus innesii]
MDRKKASCTTLLVGKKASIDGSTMIARNEDSGSGSEPQKFVVITPEQQGNEFYAVLSGCRIRLPKDPLRYTSTPEADESQGVWAASGINEENIAMTATETITTNSRVLAIDPYVEDGIGEADFVSIVLPYIHSAKEGVLRLGELLETYGTYEANGIAFSDAEEIWYMETIGGHHWAAVRLPDDAYVVAPNRLNIDHFDFASEMTLCSQDLEQLIEDYQLNPDFEGINLRHIFGSSSEKDTRYNNPRAWYIQKHFSGTAAEPIDQELPFVCYPKQKLSVEDVKWALSSHFQNTPFDPYGTGTETQKTQFRSIALNRNQQVHILQIRNHVPAAIAGIHWLAFGPNTFNGVVPFYAAITKTPLGYCDTTKTYDPTNSYWLGRTLALIGDSDYDRYSDLANRFEMETMAACRRIQQETDCKASAEKEPTRLLEEANAKMAELYLKNATTLLGKMVESGSKKMALRFSLAD